jgi:hypothetical protein
MVLAVLKISQGLGHRQRFECAPATFAYCSDRHGITSTMSTGRIARTRLLRHQAETRNILCLTARRRLVIDLRRLCAA